MARKKKDQEEESFTVGPGLTLEEVKTDPTVLERAMLRVRHRHEDAGDANKLTFGDLLMEAREEAKRTYERLARGEDYTKRSSLGSR
jgi:hypothetical protein